MEKRGIVAQEISQPGTCLSPSYGLFCGSLCAAKYLPLTDRLICCSFLGQKPLTYLLTYVCSLSCCQIALTEGLSFLLILKGIPKLKIPHMGDNASLDLCR